MSVASTGGPSRTVTVTLYGLPAAALKAIVPLIRPVGGVDREPRRQAAGRVGQRCRRRGRWRPRRGRPGRSRRRLVEPRSWSKLGSRFVFVTVQVKLSVASTAGPSRTVTVTLYGLPAAALKAIVPLIRPVAASIASPGGRPLAA